MTTATNPSVRFSVCPHDCPGACALDVEIKAADRIGRVRGAKDMPYTDGVVCAKVARYAERAHHPDRLTTPLKRTGAKGEGRFAPISWAEALDRTADAFKRAADEHGAQSIWPYNYAGTMGLVQRDGLERFRRVMGTSLMDGTICSNIGKAGWKAGVGSVIGTNPLVMAEAELIVLWGMNPVATQINVMCHIAKARKKHGAKLVVIDPHRTATAEKADIHIAPKPGTDDALACAMINVLLAENLADREFLAAHTDFDGEIDRHFAQKTPEWAAEITGLQAEDIVSLARLYGRTERSFIRIGMGVSRSRNGAAKVHAISALPAVSGAWSRRGAGALLATGDTFANMNRTLIVGADHSTSARTLDMCQIGRVLTGDADALKGGPPVMAMIVQNTNPAVVAPESELVRQGLLREDLFFCVHEQFMTTSAKYADIVLPATTFLEHDDLYTSYGQTYLQASRAVIGRWGEARSNHEVICALAERLGLVHEGFEISEWEMIDRTLRASNLPGADEVLAQRWVDCAPPASAAPFADGFPTADGRFHFRADWDLVGSDTHDLPPLPDHMRVLDEATEDHPFRLVAGPARQFLNSTFSETESSKAGEGGRPTAQIHPADADRLGVSDGAPVQLGNGRGRVSLHAKITDAVRPGVVVVESIWPNEAFIGGMGINALSGADRVAPAGGCAFHDTAVWIKPAA
ncbi:MAG: molybdopterin oxidoreductase family protein [Rhodospirillales bacterium]|nr:molybdopterin oxidoreductase family protein [Rhodospirillales bacterium]